MPLATRSGSLWSATLALWLGASAAPTAPQPESPAALEAPGPGQAPQAGVEAVERTRDRA